MERITIRDYSWGIDRATGERKERLVEERCFDSPFEVGQKLSLKMTNKSFEIVKLMGDKVEIIFSPNRNIVLDGYKITRPLPKALSMDGGHKYEFEYEYDCLEVLNDKHELISRFTLAPGEKTLPKEFKKEVYVGPDAGFSLDRVIILSNGNIYFAMDEFHLEDKEEKVIDNIKVAPTLIFRKNLLER